MRITITKICISLMLVLCVSCSPKKDVEEIGQHIAGVDTRINRVLVNKYAFEKAIVKIRGKVKNFERNTENNTITFELTDRKGNFINIHSEDDNDIEENDYILLSGEYNSADNLLIMHNYEKFPI